MPEIVRKKKTGRATNQGVKLIIIRDYLYSQTDETHYATSKDIIEHLELKGIRADRKTIFNDITRLQDDLGLKIERKKHRGFRILEPKFEPNELRLMVDSVQSAKFITQKEADTLKKKIKSLGPVQLNNAPFLAGRSSRHRAFPECEHHGHSSHEKRARRPFLVCFIYYYGLTTTRNFSALVQGAQNHRNMFLVFRHNE